MISFSNVNISFKLLDTDGIITWIAGIIFREGFLEGEINYVFCSDDYLVKINQAYLNHNTLTDIITFDYTAGKTIHSEIYISIDRVKENASLFNVSFTNELHRVMLHGVLHCCGYKDKTSEEIRTIRNKEDYYLKKIFHT